MEIDFGTPDSDEGVELSPTANVSSIDLLGYALEEEKSIPLFSEAETVYILLPKDVAVSRASRFQWLLDHLNTVVSVPSRLKLDVASPNLEVISVVPKKGEAACTNKYLITTKTSVKFLAYSYCFVYCVDMSPSQSAVDIQKGEILFDEIVQCIKATVEGLCRQFTIPGNSLVFQPSVYLTVIVNTPFFMSPAQQVLVEGVQITAKNVHEIINLIEGQFHFLEERIAQVSAIAHDEIELQQSEREHISSSVFYINECGENVSNIPIVLPDVNFVNMLRYSMLAISLLPENSLSNILVVTDGVVAMPDSNIMESLLMQLHYDSISVSFLKVGSSFHPQTSAGYISYTDLLHFISQATLGSCLEDFPFVKLEPSLLMNKYQESFLLWSFQNKINYDNILATQSRPIHSNDIFDKRFPILLCKRQTEENINASTDLLVSRRMREGYNVDSVNYNDNFLHISLSLHWKALIYIQYHMYYQWPLIKNIVRVEIHILAPYEFLHDITCVMRKELKSSYRQAVIERFWLRISQLSKGDSFLAQQLSFMPNSSVWYMLPESVKSGIPVFILQGSDPTKLILTPSDVSSTKFVSLWQSICQIETSNWRKWFHTYKLSVALKYDHPLPKHLHLANSSGRYQVIQCRQAASSLYSLLSEWASFVLIDNHTYLKLLFEEPDKPPAWFCLVRITSKFPCAIVNLAFLTSTPGATRRKICEELQYDLSLLSYSSSPVKSKENLCCTLLKKPLERVLIRYERIPTDFTTVVFPDGTQPSYTMRSFPPSPLASTLFTTLSRYLYHKRWIWSTSHVINPKLELPTVSRILSILTRMRIKEGFSFAHSSSGIITMVLELSMEPDSTCMVQYVLFPPHRAWREGECVSGSEEDGDVDMELESELQMVTEVWVEPQYGTVSLSDSQTNNHFNHKRYYELADVIYRLDSECISSLLTLEHLSLICQNKTAQPMYEIGKHKHRSSVAGRYKRSPNQNSLRNSFIERICDVKERIQHVPFNFDPISILSLCQQTELLFSMFIESSDRVVALNQYDHEKSNRLLLDTIHEHLQYLHDYEFDVTTEESERLMEQIMSRHRNKFSHVCPITNKAFNTSDLMLQWKCYIKGISKMHVILTFVPATLCSLKKLVSIEGTYTPSLNDSSESTERASSRGSNVSDVPINASSTLVLPVYVFDCPLALLVESYINDVTNTVMVDRDVYEDHRFKFGFHVHEDSVRLKGDESMETRHYEMESNESKNSIKSHCKALVLTHSKCFVLSLFATLQHGFYVHTSDVHFAMDQCDETVHDIDITYYLQTICGHMKSNEVGQISVESLHQPLLCNELKPLHHLIKDRFSDIMNAAFSPIPSNREFYYCRNLVVDKQVAKVDSDDEISIPPSDGVEFKSDKEASSSSEVTSNFMRLDSTNSILINSLITPLFIHLICTVRYGSNVANSSVKVLPTCLGELIENIHSDVTFLEKSSLQITLDILCLTLPLDVQNVINDYSTRGMRTTSFCSDGFPPSVASTTSEASFPAEFSDPLGHLPDLQKRAISNLKDKA
uniref:Protein SZT2 n=1 Tax=Photinus pyralis TaxID=7054 RepID=A0A1Y1NFY9_PHOPY